MAVGGARLAPRKRGALGSYPWPWHLHPGGLWGEAWARSRGTGSVPDVAVLWFLAPCRSGPGAACRLARAESERRCRAPGQPPGGALCHGRGRCDCGVCICHVSEPGMYFGPLCECHEWVCETYDGSTCAGKGRAASSPRRPGAEREVAPGFRCSPSPPQTPRVPFAGRQGLLSARLI